MTIADERILEYLSEVEASSPKKMAENGEVRFSNSHVGQRCRKLAEYGLLQPLGNGVYRITESGREYLQGEVDAAELESK